MSEELKSKLDKLESLLRVDEYTNSNTVMQTLMEIKELSLYPKTISPQDFTTGYRQGYRDAMQDNK
mgnify:CR=1 FL=1